MPNLNDVAWEILFERYNILCHIEDEGQFRISANQIKEVREPRLMTKFDHTVNLPRLFADNQLAILPVTRGDYVISHFDAYHTFEPLTDEVVRVALPDYLQSLNSQDIPSEAIALNCAVASGIIADFVQDDELCATVSGRMSSGSFDFNIVDFRTGRQRPISVVNSQIEIDAAYEGIAGLALFEAKRDLSDDFLVRQLYYPFRTWSARVEKPVRPVFLVYSNGIYNLYMYEFVDLHNYCSIRLVRQKNYTIEDTAISTADIQSVLDSVVIVVEPNIPFPQADKFERVINLLELIGDGQMSRAEVTANYDFDARQTNYYTDAARYLGLLERGHEDGETLYSTSQRCGQLFSMSYRQRQLAFCRLILSHQVFRDTLRRYFQTGTMPPTQEIVQIMRSCDLHNVESDSTYNRRASTIKGWLNWIVSLINS